MPYLAATVGLVRSHQPAADDRELLVGQAHAVRADGRAALALAVAGHLLWLWLWLWLCGWFGGKATASNDQRL